MARIYSVLTFMIVTTLLFNFSGLVVGTPSSTLLGWMGVLEPQDFQTSGLYIALFGIFTLLAVGGIAIGTVVKDATTITLVASAGLCLVLILLAGDFVSMYLKLREFNEAVALLVFAPFVIGWLLIIYDWWRGNV